MTYIYKGDYAVGWVDDDNIEMFFTTPIPANLLTE